mmetsp:Transcript_25637/g.35694  ORF Transcript_25637/g.35694 Transcript_25637/m.35694 type:complete len:195 (+) Transcript_25637:260-844(+)
MGNINPSHAACCHRTFGIRRRKPSISEMPADPGEIPAATFHALPADERGTKEEKFYLKNRMRELEGENRALKAGLERARANGMRIDGGASYLPQKASRSNNERPDTKHTERMGDSFEWVKYIDEGRGIPYYCNIKTNETTWEPPDNYVIDISVKNFQSTLGSSGARIYSRENSLDKAKEMHLADSFTNMKCRLP